jgi:Coenzyme PQQ synthesis protein D (PqqD)
LNGLPHSLVQKLEIKMATGARHVNKDSISLLPRARKDKLIIKELPDETLVYDLESDKAHCLNATAARVWKHCDGTTSVGEIAASLNDGIATEPNEDVVWLALDQLEEFQLLSQSITKPMRLAGISRRQLMRTLGFTAALSIPLISSIIVPTAVQAASCTAINNRDNDCPCTTSAQCTSGCCRAGLLVCKSGGGSCL